MRMESKNINLRLVDVEDAEFILGLRMDENLNRFLSRVENDLNKQIEWIKNYKLSESLKKEYYFIIEGKNSEKYGTVKVYDLRSDSFCWGSWVVKIGSPAYVAIESALLTYIFGFNNLGFKKSHFEVRKDNKRVLELHKKFGAQIISEDKLNFYFSISKNIFLKTYDKNAVG